MYLFDIEHSSLNSETRDLLVDQTQAFILAPSENPDKMSIKYQKDVLI